MVEVGDTDKLEEISRLRSHRHPRTRSSFRASIRRGGDAVSPNPLAPCRHCFSLDPVHKLGMTRIKVGRAVDQPFSLPLLIRITNAADVHPDRDDGVDRKIRLAA